MLTYNELWTACQRRTKTETDQNALNSFKLDLKIAEQIVASRKNWQELKKTQTITFDVNDDTQALTDDIDVLEQVRITSPIAYEKPLLIIDKEEFRKYDPVTSNSGTGTPDICYLSEPTIQSDNVETKNLSVSPVPDQTYVLTYSYKRMVTAITDPADYPFFNRLFHQILIDYAIWKYAEREPDETLNPNFYKSLWDQGLADLDAFYQTQIQKPLAIPTPDKYGSD